VSETEYAAQKSSVPLRPFWTQVAIMFVCSIPVVAIVAGAATALPFVFPYVVHERNWGWYMLVAPLSPGWLWPALLASHGDSPGFNFDDLFRALFGNFVYWFVWIFWFVLWSDRRWPRNAPRHLGRSV
jgi:hypothetical protein